MDDFETIYKENYPKMTGIAYKMVGDKDVVRDIVQEVFVSYYEKTENRTLILQPKSWLLRATINKSIDYLKRKKKQLDLSSVNHVESEETETVEQQQMQAILQKALKKLKPQEMKLAVLYSESFSYKEMAEIAGINPNSVGKTLSRTLQKLKTILKQMNYEMY